MKIAALLMTVPLCLMSVSAIAGMSQTKGHTSCLVISSISNNKAHEVSCSYTGSVGGSMSYSIEQMDYKLATGEKYRTINDATFDFDKNGKVKDLEEEVSLDGNPAKLKNMIDGAYADDGAYKELSDSDLEKRYEADVVDLTDVLKCFIPDNAKDTAFCLPFLDPVEIDGMA